MMPIKKLNNKKRKKTKKSKKPKQAQIEEASIKIWESKIEALLKSRNEYRESARQLCIENETLQTQVQQLEKDTLEVLTFLKQKNEETQEESKALKEDVEKTKECYRKEKEKEMAAYVKQIEDLKKEIRAKDDALASVEHKLQCVKEFQQNREAMSREIDTLKDALLHAKREHKSVLYKLERRFLEEKLKLQDTAKQQIAVLSEQAHSQAVANLDETTKQMYKNSAHMAEVLNTQVKDSDAMRTKLENLQKENQKLQQGNELHEKIMYDKIQEAKRSQIEASKLEEEIANLQKELIILTEKYETDKGTIIQEMKADNQASQMKVTKLLRLLDEKKKEVAKIKKLAKNILEQRSEIEQFFLDSLEYVKNEITETRAQQWQEAQQQYNQRMRLAHSGRSTYPKIRTFTKSEASTNTILTELDYGRSWTGVNGKVDIADLTWEQRERVLRYLFTKINQNPSEKKCRSCAGRRTSLTSRSNSVSSKDGITGDKTFITQANVDRCGRLPGQRTPPVLQPISLHTTL